MHRLNCVKVSVTIPGYLLTVIDDLAKQNYHSRSGVIREAIITFLIEQRIKENETLAKINRNRLRDYLNQLLN